jgi:outer membrane receptor protein involved in Fe transport
MKRGQVFGVTFAVLLLLIGQGAWAQTTGSIRGSVVDQNGQALPGVTIVLSGDLLGGATRHDVTSPMGGFHLIGLEVGLYTVKASLSGFQTQQVENVRVSLGAVTSVDFELPEAFSEEITVVADTVVVDVSSPSYSGSLNADMIEDLPTRGNFYDTLAVTPGVVQDREGIFLVTAFGSDVQSNQWNVDGLDTTSPEGGDLYWSMNDEMIAELQVLGTGAGAEYGGMLGTAFNVVTKSGTNDFHGSAVFDYWVPDWVGTNARETDAPPGTQVFQLDHHRNLAATLGGPIKKDKVWFFAGAEFGRYQSFQPYEDPNLEGQKGTTWDNFDLKITAQPSENHHLAFRASDHEFLGPYAGSVFDEKTTWGEDYQHDNMFAADYSAVLSENSFLEVRAGTWKGDSQWRPQYPSDEWMHVDMTVDPWVYTGGFYWSWEWEPETDDAEVILTQHADDFLGGDHTFRFGVQYTKGGGVTKAFDPGYYYTAESYYYSYYYGYGYYYTWEGFYGGLPYYYGATSTSIGGFITDSFRVNEKLTLDFGVRYDRHKGRIPAFNRLDIDSNPTGEVIPGRDMVDWTNVDPRFGFAWQPTDTGKTVVRGSIGLFHSGVVSGQWYSPPPEAPTWYSSWLNWDGEWEVFDSWPPPPETSLVEGTENASAWEYTLGFEHQVSANSSITVQGVYKKTKDLIGWHILDDAPYEVFLYTDPHTGQEFPLRYYDVVGPTRMKGNSTGPGAVGGDRPYQQDYRGLFVSYKKRFSNDWDMLASYTYSKSEGLNPTFLDWGSQGYAMYSSRAEADPNSYINADKTLAGDRRHMIRVVANFLLPWNLKLSTVVNLQTGRPFDRHKWVDLPNHASTRIIAEPSSNKQRFPDQYLWDLSIGKHFNFGNDNKLSLDLQILNVLNDDSPEGWRTREYDPLSNPVPSLWVLPRRAELRLRFEF